MKLQAIMTLSMALALPAALQAQTDDMEITFRIDPTGIALKIDGAYSNGNFAILISEDGTGTTELGELDSRSLDLGSPMVLIADQANAWGEYYVHFQLDPQALADAGLKVYLQAVSLNDSDFGDDGDEGEEGNPSKGDGFVRISARLDLDFAEEQWAENAPGESDDEDKPESEERRGDGDGTEEEKVKH
jgi:hypothetical protein